MTQTPTDALRRVPVEPTSEMIRAMCIAIEDRELLDESDPNYVDGYDALIPVARYAWQDALAAAPASPLPGGGWQDISTAPKDGTEVLVMLKPKVIRLGWYFKPSSRTEGWCDENGKRIIPSHWMPLPAAPTGDA